MSISITLLPLVVALIGLALYFLPKNGKVNTVGLVLFVIGSFLFLSTGSHGLVLK